MNIVSGISEANSCVATLCNLNWRKFSNEILFSTLKYKIKVISVRSVCVGNETRYFSTLWRAKSLNTSTSHHNEPRTASVGFQPLSSVSFNFWCVYHKLPVLCYPQLQNRNSRFFIMNNSIQKNNIDNLHAYRHELFLRAHSILIVNHP